MRAWKKQFDEIIMPEAQYLPELVLCDFFLFRKIENALEDLRRLKKAPTHVRGITLFNFFFYYDQFPSCPVLDQLFRPISCFLSPLPYISASSWPLLCFSLQFWLQKFS